MLFYIVLDRIEVILEYNPNIDILKNNIFLIKIIPRIIFCSLLFSLLIIIILFLFSCIPSLYLSILYSFMSFISLNVVQVLQLTKKEGQKKILIF